MCVQCVVYSTLMMFMPAPQPVNVAQVNAPEAAVYSQINTSKVASDTQNAIAEMLKQLPKTSDMSFLRVELNSLYAQLATVKNDGEAQTLIDTTLRSISERLKEQPNYEQINQRLMGMLEVKEDEPSTKSLVQKIWQNKSFQGKSFKTQGKTVGWLH
ncbi:MAG TPA: hypothetical protein V6D28_29460 [Leptolyngbyaceae cyanobacterium]